MPPLYKAKSEFLEGLLVAHDDRPRPRLRSEEHTSELQSQSNLVCRLLLEKKKRTSGGQMDRYNFDTLWAMHEHLQDVATSLRTSRCQTGRTIEGLTYVKDKPPLITRSLA